MAKVMESGKARAWVVKLAVGLVRKQKGVSNRQKAG
jgi:hypothetical protein